MTAKIRGNQLVSGLAGLSKLNLTPEVQQVLEPVLKSGSPQLKDAYVQAAKTIAAADGDKRSFSAEEARAFARLASRVDYGSSMAAAEIEVAMPEVMGSLNSSLSSAASLAKLPFLLEGARSTDSAVFADSVGQLAALVKNTDWASANEMDQVKTMSGIMAWRNQLANQGGVRVPVPQSIPYEGVGYPLLQNDFSPGALAASTEFLFNAALPMLGMNDDGRKLTSSIVTLDRAEKAMEPDHVAVELRIS